MKNHILFLSTWMLSSILFLILKPKESCARSATLKEIKAGDEIIWNDRSSFLDRLQLI